MTHNGSLAFHNVVPKRCTKPGVGLELLVYKTRQDKIGLGRTGCCETTGNINVFFRSSLQMSQIHFFHTFRPNDTARTTVWTPTHKRHPRKQNPRATKVQIPLAHTLRLHHRKCVFSQHTHRACQPRTDYLLPFPAAVSPLITLHSDLMPSR